VGWSKAESSPREPNNLVQVMALPKLALSWKTYVKKMWHMKVWREIFRKLQCRMLSDEHYLCVLNVTISADTTSSDGRRLRELCLSRKCPKVVTVGIEQ
jgi:hypothetical protein